MILRRLTSLAGLALIATGGPLSAQEHPVRRAAFIVTTAVEEYAKGVGEHGETIAASEYDEAIGFLGDAKQIVDRLAGDRVAVASALLDSIIAGAHARKPPHELSRLDRLFTAALGDEAALQLPRLPVDLAEGRAIFQASCASCHGPRGNGDGPAAATIKPPPAPIGDAKLASGVTPATMFRVISVGVSGTAMANFASSLTPDQRWNVVAYITSLRATAATVGDGEGLYVQMCAQCHGAAGGGDGVMARSLSRVPPELGSLGWQATRSDDSLMRAIRSGVAGTPMPPAPGLSEAQARSVVAYLRTFPMKAAGVEALAAAADSGGFTAAARNASALVEQALTAAKLGRKADAADRAFDAYLAFEPLETPARARNPGLVASMERHFADFKAAVKTDDLNAAESARDAIDANLPVVVGLTRSTGRPVEAFSQSLLIILREGFEAILVIGAIVAFLLKTGHRERMRSIWMGIALALVASGLTAVLLRTLLAAVPASQEILEGATLLVAVGVLFSVSYWLISKVEAANWQRFIKEKVTNALQHGGGTALAFVAFLAVYREGAETALFYQALFNESAHSTLPIVLGIVAGGIGLAIVFTLFYKFGVSVVPLRPFFTVTSVMLYYMAFVFMGKGIRELQEGNAVPISFIPGFPTVDALGLYPTWQTLLGQLLLLALFVFAVAKSFWPRRSVALPTISATAAAGNETGQRLAELRAEIEALRARQSALEDDVQRATSPYRVE